MASSIHRVRQGESLLDIARSHGFDGPQPILDHPGNASLFGQRRNLNQLVPGDEVVIPERQQRVEKAATGARHRFIAERVRAEVKVVLQDVDGGVLAGVPWTLTVGDDVHDGVTGDDGLVEVALPDGARTGRLLAQVDPDDPDHLATFELWFAALDPVETVTGVQGRLANLGYDVGPIDGVEGDRTQAALDAFRRVEGIDEAGPCGPATRDALGNRYGS